SDDDTAPTVTLSLAGRAMAEAGGGQWVDSSLSAVWGQAVTVDLGFTGTASYPADYTRSATSITIPAGQISGSVTLTGVQDVLDEIGRAAGRERMGGSEGAGHVKKKIPDRHTAQDPTRQ